MWWKVFNLMNFPWNFRRQGDRASLTERLTIKGNVNAYSHGNEWMKEYNYALQNADTRLRLQSTTQNYGVTSGKKKKLRFRGLGNTSSLRKLFFESLPVVFVASVPCLRVVASLVSSYCFLRGVAMGLCRRCVIFTSSCRRVFLSSTALHTWAGTWCMGTYIVLLLCYPVTFLLCYLIALSPCYSVPLSPCYPLPLFPCYSVVNFFNFSVFVHDKSQFSFPYRRVFFSEEGGGGSRVVVVGLRSE